MERQEQGADRDVSPVLPEVLARPATAPDALITQDDETRTLLRIDELAQHVGLPSRTVRFYNTQGLLPAPLMHGRVAFYTQEHVQILHIIRELKERQNLSLDTIKQLLAIRAQQGDLHMNLALKQRLRFATGEFRDQRLALAEFAHRCAITPEQVHEFLAQDLLFPTESEGELYFSSDDVLLVELYQHFAQLGLPLALPTLIRFQLRQLVRSETAAYEQHLLPRWTAEGLSLEAQAEEFERMVTLTDTLISLMHRRLLYKT